MSDPRYTDPRYSDPRRPVEPNAPRRRMDIEDGSGAMWGWVAAIAAIVVVIALMIGYHRMDFESASNRPVNPPTTTGAAPPAPTPATPLPAHPAAPPVPPTVQPAPTPAAPPAPTDTPH